MDGAFPRFELSGAWCIRRHLRCHTAAALFFPFSTIYLFFAVPMPMIVFALGYIIWSAVASAGRLRDGVGHAAHLGGALAGAAIVCLLWPEAPQAMIDQLADRLRGF
jgi:membrane associated rhomboid family serine protease